MLLGIVAGYPNTGLRFVLTLADACRLTPNMTVADFLTQTAQPSANDPFAEEWLQLNEALKAVAMPDSIGSFQPWLASVARFSFSPEGDVLGASANANNEKAPQ
jgi:hypothetical protein